MLINPARYRSFVVHYWTIRSSKKTKLFTFQYKLDHLHIEFRPILTFKVKWISFISWAIYNKAHLSSVLYGRTKRRKLKKNLGTFLKSEAKHCLNGLMVGPTLSINTFFIYKERDGRYFLWEFVTREKIVFEKFYFLY